MKDNCLFFFFSCVFFLLLWLAGAIRILATRFSLLVLSRVQLLWNLYIEYIALRKGLHRGYIS